MSPFAGHRNAMSKERLEEIHQAALSLAEDIGLLVSHNVLLERLVGRNGIRITGQRVYFCAEIIEQALSAMRFPAVPYPDRITSYPALISSLPRIYTPVRCVKRPCRISSISPSLASSLGWLDHQ